MSSNTNIIFDKVQQVILTCVTHEQTRIAEKYVNLYFKKYKDLPAHQFFLNLIKKQRTKISL